MEGAALATRRRIDIAMLGAWHAEAFARTKRMPKLADVLSEKAEGSKPQSGARAFFLGLAAKGVPIEITRH